MHDEGKDIPASWGRMAASGADAGQIAEHVIVLWRGIMETLSPIIGQAGVVALYQRSVFLTRHDHPCLQKAVELASPPDQFAPLHAVLTPLSAADAANAAAALMHTFRDLLDHLIGSSLTERLLRSIWNSPSSGQAAQDSAS
jgi:hypothetical protein